MSHDQDNGTPESDEVGEAKRQSIRQYPKARQIGLPLIFISLMGWCLIGWLTTSQDSFVHILCTFALDIGILILFIWCFRFFVMPIVRKEQIVEEWAVLIQGGQEHASEIIERTRGLMVTSRAPDVTMEEKEMSPGVIRGFLGNKRPFLVISNRSNGNLKTYEMYLNARDYGNNLQVAWYVIHRPGIGETILRLSLLVPFLNLLILPIYFLTRLSKAREAGILGLDLFDAQDLKAYVTNAHHCVLETVDQLLLDLNRDPSKIERKSRGFLGIS